MNDDTTVSGPDDEASPGPTEDAAPGPADATSRVSSSPANPLPPLNGWKAELENNGAKEHVLAAAFTSVLVEPELLGLHDLLLDLAQVPAGPVRDAARPQGLNLLATPAGVGGLDMPTVVSLEGKNVMGFGIEFKGKNTKGQASNIITLGRPLTQTAKDKFPDLDDHTPGPHPWTDDCCSSVFQHKASGARKDDRWEAVLPQLHGLEFTGGVANAIPVQGDPDVRVDEISEDVRGLIISFTTDTRDKLAAAYGVEPEDVSRWTPVTWARLLTLIAEKIGRTPLGPSAQEALTVLTSAVWWNLSWTSAHALDPRVAAWIAPELTDRYRCTLKCCRSRAS